MTEKEINERKMVLDGLKRQYDSLFSQRSLYSDLVEHYAKQIVDFGVSRLETPNFWSLGYASDLAKFCRHFLNFFDSCERLDLGISSLSEQMSVIKQMIK